MFDGKDVFFLCVAQFEGLFVDTSWFICFILYVIHYLYKWFITTNMTTVISNLTLATWRTMEPSHFSGGHQKNGARLLIVSTLNRHRNHIHCQSRFGCPITSTNQSFYLLCAPRKISAYLIGFLVSKNLDQLVVFYWLLEKGVRMPN